MEGDKDTERQLLAKWIAQRDNLNRLIEALQLELGEEVVEPAPGTLGIRGGTPAVIVGPPQIKPGEFFGLSQTDAAARYIKRVGYAVYIDQILENLKVGGVKFSGADPRTNLYTLLVRGTRRFVLVSANTFGLTEFYPKRPRAGKNIPNKKLKKGKRKKKRPRLKLFEPKEALKGEGGSNET